MTLADDFIALVKTKNYNSANLDIHRGFIAVMELLGFDADEKTEVLRARLNPTETFYAIRRTDGEEIGDYAWLRSEGPDDWSVAEDDYDFYDHESVEYEIVEMSVRSVARRTFGGEE